ncbi:MAG: copper resistance protein NlpE N-terminal domain-containing protein [Caldilineaceae bacterium]
MLQSGAFQLYRLEQITPAMMDAMTAPSVVTTYQSDTLPAASSPGRVITLTLYNDGSLEMSTDFLNDEPPIVEVGTWEQGDDDTLTVTLTGRPDRTYDEPVVIVFAQDGATLDAVEYDTSLYGSEGLSLTEQSAAE